MLAVTFNIMATLTTHHQALIWINGDTHCRLRGTMIALWPRRGTLDKCRNPSVMDQQLATHRSYQVTISAIVVLTAFSLVRINTYSCRTPPPPTHPLSACEHHNVLMNTEKNGSNCEDCQLQSW